MAINKQPEPKVRLVFTQPEFGGRWCELPEGHTLVGRGAGNQLVIREDSVSVTHCEILVNWAEVIVRERGSRNGTFINGVRVAAQSGAKHGQTIRFGRVTAVLELERHDDDLAWNITAMPGLLRRVAAEGSSDGSTSRQIVTVTPDRTLSGEMPEPSASEGPVASETSHIAASPEIGPKVRRRSAWWVAGVLLVGLALLLMFSFSG